MLLNSINSLSAEKAYEIGLKKSNINFRSSSTNSLERTPEEDTVEKKETSKGKKIALGSLAALGGLALVDVCFNKSRCLKKIFGRAEAKTDEIVGENLADNAKPTRGFKAESFKENLKTKRSERVRKAMDSKKLQAQKRLRKDLASKGKLDFELKIGNDRIIVKKGEISECYNAQNEKWAISKDTDPDFVQKIKKAIEERISEILKTK